MPWRSLPASSPSMAARSASATVADGDAGAAARSRSTATRSSGRPGRVLHLHVGDAGDALERGLELLRERRELVVVGRAHLHHDRRLGRGALDERRVGDDDARAREPSPGWCARATSWSSVRLAVRSSFGSVTTRHLTLLTSPFGPSVDEDGDEALVLEELRLGGQELSRPSRSSEVPAGSSMSTTNWPRSSGFTNSLPVRPAIGNITTNEATAMTPTTQLVADRPAQDRAVGALHGREDASNGRLRRAKRSCCARRRAPSRSGSTASGRA